MMKAYIGDLSDPEFNWNNQDFGSITNIPRQIGPELLNPNNVSDLLAKKIRSGELEGRKIDWGSDAAKVTKKQLREFVEELYSKRPVMPWQQPALENVKKFIEGLEDDKLYALVACELW